jgi:ParB family transcriptional regulator, chromosome partitioning protein
MMNVEMRPVDKIKVTDRVRDTVGDLHELKESMLARGLINPITIQVDGTLVAGERRLTAARELGWAEIPCHVWQDDTADELIAIEIEENTCRADLTLVEAEKAWQRYRRLLKPLTPIGRPRDDQKVRPMGVLKEPKGELNQKAAEAVGYGRPTMERVQEVRETAEDDTQPERVRDVAKEELGKLSKSNRGAAPALEKVRREKRQATRDAMAPGQRLKSDEPKAPPKVVSWNDRLWKVIGAGGIPQDIAAELELDPDTSSLSDDDITGMAKMLQGQIADRQRLRKVLLTIKEERKVNHNGREE